MAKVDARLSREISAHDEDDDDDEDSATLRASELCVVPLFILTEKRNGKELESSGWRRSGAGGGHKVSASEIRVSCTRFESRSLLNFK